MKIVPENYRVALKLQKEGKYKEAIATASKITQPIFRAGIFIDCGFYLKKPSIVREGIVLFESFLKKKHGRALRATLLYNIGNGYSNLYDLKLLKHKDIIPPNDDDLRKAKYAYRQAMLEIRKNNRPLRSQILVNYANCLTQLGRCFEAIKFYNEALELEPKNGMAAGNLGIELNRIAALTGRYTHHYLLEAYKALDKACGPDMHLAYGGLEAGRGFNKKKEQLKAIIDSHKTGLEPLKKNVLSKRKTIDRYIQFCLERSLFLNAWIGDQTVTPAMSDEIAFDFITTKVTDNETVPELLRVLNEIKEAYACARFHFYFALAKSRVLDEISKITSFFDYSKSDLHGLYLGLCKSSYIRSFDVLDKVARIVNIYFKIGKRTDSFWHIFAVKQSRGEKHEIRFIARPAICLTQNCSLYALSDLCIDYFESEHLDFKTIDARRNFITHDYLAVVQKACQSTNKNEVLVDELYRQTLAVLNLAKYAILYAVSAIHFSEKRKIKSERKITVHYKQSFGHTSPAIRRKRII